jgi:steroid delta-isomerase-like uncharacterized protein
MDPYRSRLIASQRLLLTAALGLTTGCAAAHAQSPHIKESATMTTTTTTTASPETLARRYFDDIWNRRDIAAIDQVVAANVVGHVNATTLHGKEVLKTRVGALAAAYPDRRFTIEDLVADRDRVVVRWTFEGTNTGPLYGNPATGRRVSVTGMNLFRVAAGRITELWVSADDLGELEQLGLVTAPKGAGQ